ncbi:MAG: GAF domain-containing protein [Bacteroidales bacterium]|nr:GAF domain-containing protein [Bacteroidales bacterium]
MKNKRVIVYINFIIMFFSLMAIVLIFLKCQYFSLIAASLAFLTIILSILNIVIINSREKQFQIELDQNQKDNQKDVVTIEEQELQEENKCLKLVESIDQSLPLGQMIDQKLERLANPIQLVAGLIYLKNDNQLKLNSVYALVKEEQKQSIELGEGLSGQVAKNGKPIELALKDQIEIEIVSGLGSAKPNYLYILPIFDSTQVVAIVELATFVKLNERRIDFIIEALRKV